MIKIGFSIFFKLFRYLLILTYLCSSAFAYGESKADTFFSMSIDELLNVKVHSVSKQDEPLANAAAPIYIITHDAIQNAGVNSIAEALRLDPRLQVARISSNQYAISIRGFNTTVSNKLLVLLDGRTIYTPLFSGVFWEQQDILLEDV